MLSIYRILAWLMAPIVIRRLHRPAADHDGLAHRRGERCGRMAAVAGQPIWVHAASVGEVNAAHGLIEGLLSRWPQTPILLSTFTVTGAIQAERLFGDRVKHRFLPIDSKSAVRAWLTATQPRLGIIVETEIWPELFEQAGRSGLKLIMVNARLSEKTMRSARRFSGLYARTISRIDLALCQSKEDAARMASLGLAAERIEVSGNLKFETPLPARTLETARLLRQRWGGRPVWVAGSTRPGEESILLAAHQQLLANRPDALLVLAPRHPERSTEVRQLIADAGLEACRLDQEPRSSQQIVLVDRLGVLSACYAAAQVCFVGGSLVPIGGHNLLEPAALGKPVLSGPFLNQQQAAADALVAAVALLLVANADELAESIADLWSDPERALALGRAALAVVESGRGALSQTLDRIGSKLSAAAG